ncbi:MAG: metallophosphoesterase [Clostridiales bacterium]|nr:metallophosphoesterase [Clostridiales bacterium]
MIYLTGDIHGGMDIAKLSNRQFPKGKTLTRSDCVIICGDFGLPFALTDTAPESEFLTDKCKRADRKNYLHWIKWLSERSYTVLWLDGNHDNHPFWQDQPVEEWNGGLVNVHPLAENVLHLKRGEYYTIDGHTFWVMGGAASHDREYRTEGLDWWPEELPSEAEMAHGLATLAHHGNRVDYVLTHTLPQSLLVPVCNKIYSPDPTCAYLDKVYAATAFRYWYCGHLHMDVNHPGYRVRVLYDDVVPLGADAAETGG